MTWLLFVVLAALSWGAYVPMIHQGQSKIGDSPGPLRAFLFVGLAYFVTAVVIPLLMIARGAEPWKFATRGMSFAFLAGVLGAGGALGVIFALKSGGRPIYVAPLVFAFAPIVNVIVSAMIHPPKAMPSALFFLGIILAAAGAALVLKYKPAS
jgi:hypothetical protein